MSILDRLKRNDTTEPLSENEFFDALCEATEIRSEQGDEAPGAADILIRLLDFQRRNLLPHSAKESLHMLLHDFGYYPYVDEKFLSATSTIIREAHRVNLVDDIFLHSKQMEVMLHLINGQSVILSAPTSFGKTLLFDTYISFKRPETIALIFPTLALIDENRRRLKATFGRQYKIITHPDEPYREDEPTIFIFTQERFNAMETKPNLDFFVVDEFYLVDRPREDSGRSASLNVAIYNGVKNAKVTLMAGPYIDNVHISEAWSKKFIFLQKNFRTVAVNEFDRSRHDDKYQMFLSDYVRERSKPCLIFCNSPGSAGKLLDKIILDVTEEGSYTNLLLGNWIAQNYHKGWRVADGVKAGVAVHHGRVPRALGQLFVKLFDNGDISTLICTSTLLSGVNTNAANVFVYDKKIDRTDLDFFDFSNIKGRVGRMMKYFVGNVYLYYPTPEPEENMIRIEAMDDIDQSGEFLLANVEDGDLSDVGQKRKKDIFSRLPVSNDIIRKHLSLGSDALETLYNEVRARADSNGELLFWSGFPSREQRIALAEIVMSIPDFQAKGLFTAPTVAWGWERLYSCQTLPKFLRWFVGKFGGGDANVGLDRAFHFMSSCEFDYPRALMATYDIVSDCFPDESFDWTFFIGGLERWFRPRWMKRLDEFGVPIPVSENLRGTLSDDASVNDALAFFEDIYSQKRQQLNEGDIVFLELALFR